MENTGTWNADYAILFFGALVAPFFLYFLGRFLALVLDMSQPPRVTHTNIEQEKIEPIQITLDICDNYQNHEAVQLKKPKQLTRASRPKAVKPKASRPKAIKPKPTTAKPKKKPSTKPKDDPIQSDAVGALRGLGIKKTDAKNLVHSLCAKKDYNSLESLINDCFMCMNKS